MKVSHVFLFPIFFLLAGCSTLPSLYQSIEDIADDEAIKVSISHEAIQKDTDINVVIDVKNSMEK